MNVRSFSLRTCLALLACSACSAVVSGCAMIGTGNAGHRAAEQYASRRVLDRAYAYRQLGTRDNAHFALCLHPTCPSVTPKTLALREPKSVQPPQEKAAGAVQDHQRPDHEEQLEIAIVHFDTGSAKLDRHAQATLSQFAATARQSHRIVVSGRTDSTGSRAVNDTLAHARALAVARFLRGTHATQIERIEIDARGLCCYATQNDAEAGRQFNRRAEVAFYQLVRDAQ